MKKFLLILIVTFVIHVLPIQLYSQEQNQVIQTKNNILTINVTRLFLNEARFGYERQLSERHSIRPVFGIQFATSSDEIKSISLGLASIPFYYSVSKGYYLGLGYNYIVGKHLRLYISTEIYYNYSYYNNKYYRHCDKLMDIDSYVSLQSMDIKKTGIKFIFGKKVRLLKGEKVNLELDIFARIGIQYRIKNLSIYEKLSSSCSYGISELNEINPPEIKSSKKWDPTINTGLLICVPFN